MAKRSEGLHGPIAGAWGYVVEGYPGEGPHVRLGYASERAAYRAATQEHDVRGGLYGPHKFLVFHTPHGWGTLAEHYQHTEPE
jgi:hypothetical protein